MKVALPSEVRVLRRSTLKPPTGIRVSTYGSWSGPYYDANGNSGTCMPGVSASKYKETYAYHPAGAVTEHDHVGLHLGRCDGEQPHRGADV